jgi:hypothetical protein
MGKKYLETKSQSLESSILGVWAEAAKKQEGLDAVNPKALKKKFDDRKDKDIDNDGDIDDSDEYLHNRRKTVSKAVKGEGNAFGIALKAAKDKGEKTFVVAGKKYDVQEEVELDEDMTALIFALWGGSAMVVLPALMLFNALPPKVLSKLNANSVKAVGNLLSKFKKDKNYKPTSAELDDSKKLENEVKNKEPSIFKKAMSKLKSIKSKKEEVDLDEGFGVAKDIPAMEVGTNRYRDYALDVTPGETDPEWAQARDFKVASMKEALAKVWGLDEKTLDKSSKEGYDEEDEELKPVKGSKTMTGGKVAKVDTKPKIG